MPVLADMIHNAALVYRHRTAIIDAADGSTQSYVDVDIACNRVANSLRALGVEPGAHVALFQRNSHYWAACEGGIAKAGCVTVPLNPLLAGQEVLWLLNHSAARAVIVGAEQAKALEPLRDRLGSCRHVLCVSPRGGSAPEWTTDFRRLLHSAEDSDPRGDLRPIQPHRIMYTSATTGLPKGVIVPNQAFADMVLTMLANQLHGATDSDRLLVVTPLTHMAIGFFWPFFMFGATSVIAGHFTPQDFCDLIATHRITHTALVPTMIIMLLQHLRDKPEAAAQLRRGSLKAIWYAGSPIPAAAAREAEEFLGPVLNQFYGFTEIMSTHPSTGITQLPAAWHAKKVGSCGRPMIGSIVRVVDDAGNDVPTGELGEIVVKAHHDIGGYWQLPEGTVGAFKGGWVHSGDIGYFDDEGFLYIKDRKNDMIISGGFNIYPAEVENVLAEHPAVQQCAVVGIPDEKWVEVPCAVVVRRQAAPPANEEELIEFVRGRVAHYKAPKRVLFVESLPVSGIGKVLRRRIREDLKKKQSDG